MSVIAQERLMQVLIGPHVSEKSTIAADQSGHVVFRVRRDATKAEIRKAVEMLLDVKVVSVTVARMPGKPKRFGRTMGRPPGLEEGVRAARPGHEIDFIGAE